ncbi:MAG: chalcone isomerase family protein [Hydrogenophaga sp.]|nr:chalcone isomerase family protein [Hydrogenophaga sp.]
MPARQPQRPSRRTVLALVLAAGVPAWASEAGDLEAVLQGLPLAGQTRLRVWGFEVYDAYLYAAPGFDLARYDTQRFGLALSYLRSFKGSDIAERSIDEMRGMAPLAAEQAERWLQAMARLFPDVRRGDRITGVHEPGRGARFFLNGQRLGEIADEAFSRRFFSIWLSPDTSQPGMRRELTASLRSVP